MQQRTWMFLLTLVALVSVGCATRGWVREDTDRRLAGSEERLGRSIGEVGVVARTAGERAEVVDQRLTRLWSRRNAREFVESVDVRFRFDRADLDDGAQTALLGIVRELQTNRGLTVDLAGFTDPTGPRDYNLGLAHRRVEAVRRFLAQQGVELPRIHAIGLGPINGNGIKPAEKRRVTVRLMVASE